MLAEVRNVFDRHGVTWAPYRTVREAVERPPTARRRTRCSRWWSQPGVGSYRDAGIAAELRPAGTGAGAARAVLSERDEILLGIWA
ncbi:MAG: hypothetical protein U1E38_05475 [Rhodospirillales bacterium]